MLSIMGISFATMLSIFACAGMNTEQTGQYEETVGALKKIIESRDTSRIEEFGKKIDTEWRSTDIEMYGRLMLAFCRELAAADTGTGPLAKLCQNFAMEALRSANRLPIKSECMLLEYVRLDACATHPPVKGEAWEKLRNQQVRLWLHAYRRIEESLDKDWDPKNAPSAKLGPMVAAPQSGGGPSAGPGPEALEEYRVKSESLERAKEKYFQQYEAHELKDSFCPRAETLLVHVYSLPPPSIAELEELLNEYISEVDTRKKILTALQERMKSAISPKTQGRPVSDSQD